MRNFVAALFFVASPLVAGPATHFRITAPASVPLGSTFQFTVAAVDALDAVDTGYTGTVFVTPYTNYTFTAADAGVHTFTMTAHWPCVPIYVNDTSTGISGTTTVPPSAGEPPSGLHVVLVMPATITAGVRFSLTVELRDGSGNLASVAQKVVIFIPFPNDVLMRTLQFTEADRGSITTPVTLLSQGIHYIEAIWYDSCGTFVARRIVYAGPEVTHYSITATPNPVKIDQPTTITVTALDAANQIASRYCGSAAVEPPITPNLSFYFTGTASFTYTPRQAGTTIITVTDHFLSITGNVRIVVCPELPIAAPASAIEHTANYVASVTPADGAAYAWSIDNGFLLRGANGPTVTFTTGDAGRTKLTASVAKPNGCTSTGTATIVVKARPTASLPTQLATCGPGDVEIPVTLTGTPPFTLVWSDGTTQSGIASRTTSRTVSVVGPESYSIVSVVDANASGSASNTCAIDVDVPVEIGETPADVRVLPGETATFTVTAFGSNLHYAWFYGTAGDERFPVGTDSPSFTTWAVTKPLSFWARVWNGCGNVDMATVTATPVPPRRRAV